MKTLTVVTDADGVEAIYSDGVYISHDETIYACDIASISRGEPIVFKHMLAESVDEWPTDLADVKELEVDDEALRKGDKASGN